MISRSPLNIPAMYCTSAGLLGMPSWRMTGWLLAMGFGPFGLAKGVSPFPLVTNSLFPAPRTQVGYQPAGMKPLELLFPGLLTSNTARQLLSALAIYRVFSSRLRDTPLVVEPLSLVVYRAALSFSSTFLFLMSITETLLSLELAT